MQLRNSISPQVLSAATALLQPYAPELSPRSLVKALQSYDGEANPARLDKPMTRHEAATLLSVSLNSINRYMKEGRLKRLQISKRLVRIDPVSVQALLNPTTQEDGR